MKRAAFILACGAVLLFPAIAAAAQWFDGFWDSNLDLGAPNFHPRTIGLRIEVIDAETLLPISGAEVLLTGSYFAEHLGPESDFNGPRRELREFRLRARTEDDGVVVFALRWQKKNPWSVEPAPATGDKGASKDGEAGMRLVDDLEKVQVLEIRHARYAGKRSELGFGQVLECGQNKDSEPQPVEVFRRFEELWRAETSNPAVRFCILSLGKEFPDYNNPACKRSEFFEQIRWKDFGRVFVNLDDVRIPNLDPQTFCGPYLIYLLQIALQPSQRPEVVLSVEQAGLRDSDRGQRDRGEKARERRDEERANQREARKEQESHAGRAKADPAPDTPSAPSPKPGFETVTPSLVREKGLYVGTTGVFLNEPLGGLPAGVVIESIAHRVVNTDAELRGILERSKGQGSLMAQIWKRNSKNKWERENAPLSPGK